MRKRKREGVVADDLTAYRSSFRGSVVGEDRPTAPGISYPQPARQRKRKGGGQSGGGGRDQAQALGMPSVFGPAQPSEAIGFQSLGLWPSLPSTIATPVQEAYGRGGFEGISQMQGWYDLPEHARRQILEGARG